MVLVGSGLGTYEKLTHAGNWFDGVTPFVTTVTAQHSLTVYAPTQGHIWADVEEPLGGGTQVVMEVTADDGACRSTHHLLNQSPGYYGFLAEVTNCQSGVGTAIVASPEYTLPPCSMP